MSMIIHAKEMEDILFSLFEKYRFTEERARLLAKVHTENTLYGVNSHGINRVPQFIDYVKKGIVKTNMSAKKVESFGSIERWDGMFGSGVLNALDCTNRAIELAKENGLGIVALRNTNHWMRGGYYGWQAAEQGCISILFTNTQPNMPAWGGQESRIGNNPFVVSIPREKGHVVLDMALSQFSFGKINEYKMKGENLPFAGGWDDNNKLTKIPESILRKERGLPIGYWKGSALSMVLDMLATVLSAGNSTSTIGKEECETGISQVYLCISLDVFHDNDLQQKLLDEIIAYTHDSTPIEPEARTHYPGEKSLKSMKHNLEHGIKINEEVWRGVKDLLGEKSETKKIDQQLS